MDSDVRRLLDMTRKNVEYSLYSVYLKYGDRISIPSNLIYGGNALERIVSGERRISRMLNDALSDNDLISADILLQNGANVNGVNYRGDTPLEDLTNRKICSINAVKLLLHYGANVNHIYKYGETELMYCISNNNYECAKLLLERGALLDISSHDGFTALMLVALRGTLEFIKLILFNEDGSIRDGIDLDHQDLSGKTSLMLLAMKNNEEAIRLFLHIGASHDIKDKDRKMAIDYAKHRSKSYYLLRDL